MTNEQSTRDRVRALVRDVLQTAGVADEDKDETPRDSVLTKVESNYIGETERNLSKLVDVSSEKPVAPVPDESDVLFTRDESAKTIITEADMRGLERGARLRVAEDARLTPSAADYVREHSIELVRRARRGSGATKTIAIGSDHGGFEMKLELHKLLTELGHRVRDFGTDSSDAVDYPDFAHAVARSVSNREAELGIVIDGAGVGSAITANKVPGVRAAACYSVAVARNSREHNDANVLTLGSKTITNEGMREIVAAWLGTELSEERHRKRVAKIEAIERQYKC